MATDWITTTEAAQLSGYHPEHIRRLVRSGDVEARKFGIVWQVNKTSLLAFVNAAAKSSDKRRGAKSD
jgi:excisionase family DNA binding protein